MTATLQNHISERALIRKDPERVKSLGRPIGLPKAASNNLRLARERETIGAMIEIYCRGQHRHPHGELCGDCRDLLQYANLRLDRCRFGAEKPTCARCPVHCYKRDQRERVRAVMRYSGPRMLWKHPVLSFWHWVDGRREAAL